MRSWLKRARPCSGGHCRILGKLRAGCLAHGWILFALHALSHPAHADCIDYRRYLHWAGETSTYPYTADRIVVLNDGHAYIYGHGSRALLEVDVRDPTAPYL